MQALNVLLLINLFMKIISKDNRVKRFESLFCMFSINFTAKGLMVVHLEISGINGYRNTMRKG